MTATSTSYQHDPSRSSQEPYTGSQQASSKDGQDHHESPFMQRILDEGRVLRETLHVRIQTRPYATAAVASGLGFLAGSVVGSRLGQLVLAAAVGYGAASWFQDQRK